MVYCYGAAGDSQESILAALGLTPADLKITPTSPSGISPEPTEPPAAAFSTNGTTNGVASSNGHVEPPQPPAIDFPTWRYHVGVLSMKKAFDDVPEKDRPTIASMESAQPGKLADLLVEKAHEVINDHLAPFWPLPPELSETDVEEELHKLASQAVAAFCNVYLPAKDEEYELALPTEIDRTPVDAYEAYTQIHAEQRSYFWEGLDRECCTLVLTALIGSGKTTLAMNVVRGWSLEVPVLDRACKASKSLVVVSPKEFEAWADTIGFWQIRGKVFLIPSINTHFGDGIEQARWFQETMRKYGCSTFVLDTLFDFFGLPPHNTGDANRIAMNEQAPLLEVVRMNHWCGIVTGHAPKSEAQAIVNRDPEEAFGGHTAWTAQHRMRAVIRRKSKGVNAFITGRGGYGDRGILDERMLLFDEGTRLVSLGGKFSEYLGQTALPSILEALEGKGWSGRSDLMKATGKSKSWVYAGVKEGLKTGVIKWNTRSGRAARYALPDEPDEQEQQALL
jgi:hypothetical protein